jgi:lipoprotein Spr
MKFYAFITFILVSFGAIAQDSEPTFTPQDSLADIQEIKNICKELGIPNNEEANKDLLIFILDWRGTPYCYGGSSKSCTDCSGFTSNLYAEIYKKEIPRISSAIYNNSMPIKKPALYEGDLVFFATSGSGRISHVGVYLWDGYFAHASSSQGVIISRLREGYYKKTFVSGGAWID